MGYLELAQNVAMALCLLFLIVFFCVSVGMAFYEKDKRNKRRKK